MPGCMNDPLLGALQLAALLVFSVVASQPLFYLLVLDRASASLGGPAYVELRHRIDEVMTARLPALYLAALAAVLSVAAVGWWRGAVALAGGAGVAAACLVADAVLAVKRNVPINALIRSWSPEAPPADWAAARSRWRAAFAVRTVVLCLGLTALAFTVVFLSP